MILPCPHVCGAHVFGSGTPITWPHIPQRVQIQTPSMLSGAIVRKNLLITAIFAKESSRNGPHAVGTKSFFRSILKRQFGMCSTSTLTRMQHGQSILLSLIIAPLVLSTVCLLLFHIHNTSQAHFRINMLFDLQNFDRGV